MAGAPFDARNHSTANMWFTVQDYNDGTWLFHYWQYCECAGCTVLCCAVL